MQPESKWLLKKLLFLKKIVIAHKRSRRTPVSFFRSKPIGDRSQNYTYHLAKLNCNRPSPTYILPLQSLHGYLSQGLQN